MSDPTEARTSDAAAFLAAQPTPSQCPGARLTLATSSAATASLAGGVYEVVLSLSAAGALCWASWAASVALPTSGAAASAGVFAIRDGDMICCPSAGSPLACILTGSGTTGELALNQFATP